MDKQFSEEYAKELYESKVWETWNAEQIVRVQLFQNRLCVPFEIFHKATEEVLGRPVWTHEFAFVERLKREYLGVCKPPTFEEIIDLLPVGKIDVVCIID